MCPQKKKIVNYLFERILVLIGDFPGNSRLGPVIKKKTGIQGKQPDTTVGGSISRNYALMNVIITANIQGMIHGGIIFFGVMFFIHMIYYEIS